jgi:hypothetical protein
MSSLTLSDAGYEMLRAAVNIAREHQCRSLSRLKERLLETHPGRNADIEAAIKYWAEDVRRRYPEGVPRH